MKGSIGLALFLCLISASVVQQPDTGKIEAGLVAESGSVIDAQHSAFRSLVSLETTVRKKNDTAVWLKKAPITCKYSCLSPAPTVLSW